MLPQIWWWSWTGSLRTDMLHSKWIKSTSTLISGDSTKSSAHTHLQKLIEQAERIHFAELMVLHPITMFAVVAHFIAFSHIWIIFKVAGLAFPLQLGDFFLLQNPAQPADATNSLNELSPTPFILHVLDLIISTYGPANSNTLPMICFSTIIKVIWMNRSVRQPLGWHWTKQHTVYNSHLKTHSDRKCISVF